VHNKEAAVKLVLTSTLVALLVMSCRTASRDRTILVQPGAPGEEARPITVQEAVGASRPGATAADIRFMQGMIGHHAQALEMTALLPSRTPREDMRLLARRIELSQADEIRLMERWLVAHGQTAPAAHAHHGADAALMPGMLTAEEMDRLSAAQGKEFDLLFLRFMIKHHDGALTMVNDLLATDGAGQEPEIFAFASDVDADQRIEIDRMSALLAELLK
jgi:uncharacterized protein (DUF305 family)